MRTIMIRCPVSGQPASTGLLINETDFSRLSHLPGSMLCPSCGDRHQWAISYAWLAPVNAEGLSNGAQSKSIGPPPRPTEAG
jgi:hypothetical protein